MNIRLNSKAVTDEILALSALHTTAGGGTTLPITRDSLPGLRVIMRMVFAEITLKLAPWMENCAIDSADADPANQYDQDAPVRLELTLKNGDRFPSGTALTVKRHLEHMVAAATLGWVSAAADRSLAEKLCAHRERELLALETLLAAAASEPGPFRRRGCRW